MSFVVSANYRDRSQKNWLVRKANESIDNYEIRDRVVLKDFKFCQSYDGETGFGCTVVAVGDIDEQPEINSDSLMPIQWTGVAFREGVSGEGKYVTQGSALVLDETGIYYIS